MAIGALKGWTSTQKHVVAASYLGWTLDAFDFFLMVFVIKDVAKEFGVGREDVALAITLTLAFRALGAFIFGRLADRYGRRPVLMADIALYSVLGFATAFAPNLIAFLVIRALFGIAMGGEWGIGASLTMETVKPESRGFVSGLLQSGYPTGYLIASVVYGLFYTTIGWRGLFMVGVLPALLIFYIRRNVPESPGWTPAHAATGTVPNVLKRDWKIALYAIVLMTAFNFFSHGTQDLYPTFLQVQHKFSPHIVGMIAVTYNIGAMLGGLTFGALSQYWGRRRTIVIAALLAIARGVSVGLFGDSGDARRRCIPCAVLCPGCVGRDPGASQRAITRRCARHVPRHGLSAWQLHRVVERRASDADRRKQWWQLLHRARQRCGRGGDCDRAARHAGPRRAAQRHGAEGYALRKMSTRSGEPSLAPPIARTSMRSDGTPSSIRS